MLLLAIIRKILRAKYLESWNLFWKSEINHRIFFLRWITAILGSEKLYLFDDCFNVLLSTSIDEFSKIISDSSCLFLFCFTVDLFNKTGLCVNVLLFSIL